MFWRHNEAKINRLERGYWLQSRLLGRTRFILREGVLPSLLTWLVVMFLVPAWEAFSNRSPFSVRSMISGRWTIFIDLILLALCLLGGYLAGRWRWTDFEKKYPENSLPSRK
jgi:hypothetical protein